MKRRNKWLGPLALGLLTGVLVLAVLWPKEPPVMTMVVAARDLGAGALLTPGDLATTTLPATQVPGDAVRDPAQLAGQTLAVVRFAGEPITPRHLGTAVVLGPDERGVTLRVQTDTGLAGIMQPGMRVGLVATLRAKTTDQAVYAKAALEHLRVLYVSPDFLARPYAPATASATVQGGAATGAQAAPATRQTSEGALVLAASTVAEPIYYEVITDTVTVRYLDPAGEELSFSLTGSGDLIDAQGEAVVPEALADLTLVEPPTRRVVPVELLAALNAQGASFTLVLEGEPATPYTTAGFATSELFPDPDPVEVGP
jgi:Flp pilus assembly protein CpaB